LGLIDRENVLSATVAFVAGVIVIESLLHPWLVVDNEDLLNAFQVGELAAESLNLAFASTAFSFLLLFGFFIILGAILRLLKFEIGLHLIYAGALLSVIFTVLILIISSFVASLSPGIGEWVCLCSSIAGLISPKLRMSIHKE